MSESEGAGREEVWIEKYRPRRLADIVGQDAIVERLASYVERDDLPHMLFAGRAGIGKCATGETPVLTGDGVARMETVVGVVEGFAPVEDGTQVVTLKEDGTFDYVEPSHRFSKAADEIVEVQTRDGADLSVTPEHELLVCGSSGLTWRPAGELSTGDRLVRPLEAPLPEPDQSIDWLSALHGEQTLVHLEQDFASRHEIPAEQRYVGTKRDVVRYLREGLDRGEIADRLDLTREAVAGIIRDLDAVNPDGTSRICSLSYLRSLDCSRTTLKESVEAIQTVSPSNNTRSSPIEPLWAVDPRLARLVGLLVASGRVTGSHLEFVHPDKTLVETAETALRDLFDVEPTQDGNHDAPAIQVQNRTLTNFFVSCFDVVAAPAGDGGIGSTLVRADDDSRAAFLRAVFDANGVVTENGTLELAQEHGDIITLISYMLAGFGIPSRRRRGQTRGSDGEGTPQAGHTLLVSGQRHLERFRDRIDFSVETKAEQLSRVIDRPSGSSHDTIPAQQAATELCSRLHLDPDSFGSDSLGTPPHDRERYDEVLEGVLAGASGRLERVQEARAALAAFEPALTDTESEPGTGAERRAAPRSVAGHGPAGAASDVRATRQVESATFGRRPASGQGSGLREPADGSTRLAVDRLRTVVSAIVDELDIPAERIAERTALAGHHVARLLESEDSPLHSLDRLRMVVEALRTELEAMASSETLEHLSTLDRMVEADVYLDKVRTVERIRGDHRVYDLTVPETQNYVAGAIPTVMHNTTAAQAVARELYGDDWAEHFLELNASDERGIDVVRDRIKSFARTSFGGANYRIIFLDEADALCVPPGTEVVVGSPSSPEVKPIEEVAKDGEPIPSVDFETNQLQSDAGRRVESGVADFYELQLEDGRTVEASPEHPFFVVGPDGALVEKELRALSPGEEIADFGADVNASRCGTCEDWTTGRYCSVACEHEGHSRETRKAGTPSQWSADRVAEIVETLNDSRFAKMDDQTDGREWPGLSVWESGAEEVKRFYSAVTDHRPGIREGEWGVDGEPTRGTRENSDATAKVRESRDATPQTRWRQPSTDASRSRLTDSPGDHTPRPDLEVGKEGSDALVGHDSGGGANPRSSERLGHPVRSDWAAAVAQALQAADVKYERQPEFELSDTIVQADFLVDDVAIAVTDGAGPWGRTDIVEGFLEDYGDRYHLIVVGAPAPAEHERADRGDFEPAAVSDGGRHAVRTVEIRDIEYSHRGHAYNITMEGTPNFVLANGILTHNTSDAQSALRRTMEQFSNNVRFILSCNYSSQIIDPIQSRCAVFRFSPLSDEAVEEQIRRIADEEGIELTQGGIDALVYAADGDMRRAINGLQAAAVTDGPVDEAAVYEITSTARPEDIRQMVTRALDGDFTGARSELDRLLTEEGIAGGDILDQLHRAVWEFDLDDEAAVRVLDRIGEADYRITEGANERIQLEALLASLALD